jgi:hypothetical protein
MVFAVEEEARLVVFHYLTTVRKTKTVALLY